MGITLFDSSGIATCPESGEKYKLDSGYVSKIIISFVPGKRQMMNSASKNFGIIGVAGFIAVRHLKAIKDTG